VIGGIIIILILFIKRLQNAVFMKIGIFLLGHLFSAAPHFWRRSRVKKNKIAEEPFPSRIGQKLFLKSSKW